MKTDLPIDVLDPAVRRAVEKAEKSDGYRYGSAFYEDGGFVQCFVSVDFYPTRRWYIRIGDAERQPLTPEIFAKVQPLRL